MPKTVQRFHVYRIPQETYYPMTNVAIGPQPGPRLAPPDPVEPMGFPGIETDNYAHQKHTIDGFIQSFENKMINFMETIAYRDHKKYHFID